MLPIFPSFTSKKPLLRRSITQPFSEGDQGFSRSAQFIGFNTNAFIGQRQLSFKGDHVAFSVFNRFLPQLLLVKRTTLAGASLL